MSEQKWKLENIKISYPSSEAIIAIYLLIAYIFPLFFALAYLILLCHSFKTISRAYLLSELGFHLRLSSMM